MLRSLHIKNYVLIDSLDVIFPGGLIIISGQTGAGKSILLGALSLLTGAKADASVISEGADSCVVEAEFLINDPLMEQMLNENDIEYEDGHLIIRRVVNSSGRSRAFINDCPVQVAILQSISSHLVDIHSQHQTLLLSDHKYQMSVLDLYAGNKDLLTECAAAYREVSSLKSKLERIGQRLQHLEAERDYNAAQFRQLDAAGLREGELEELEEEHKGLANAEQIKAELYGIENLSVLSDLRECGKAVARVSKFLPAVSSFADRIESSRIDIEDVFNELSSINEKLSLPGDRLAKVEERMTVLYDLMRKHSCDTISELIAKREAFSSSLCDSEALADEEEEIKKLLKEAGQRLDLAAGKLSENRKNAKDKFASEIRESLRFLELDKAVFQVVISDSPISQSGGDAVSFLFSADGKIPSDVSKCASGGELSRIMLCLKAMMAKFADMPTLVFDEIDTGVSGSVADKMGSMICDMGSDMQVFAITHLPQVAAKGMAHYLVSKNQSEGRTISTVKLLSEEGRISELARMLSGSSVTDAAIQNAKSLLGIN